MSADLKDVLLYEAGLDEGRLVALNDALLCQPPTAANPDESPYERGRFDGIIEFGKAIAKLREEAKNERSSLSGEVDHQMRLPFSAKSWWKILSVVRFNGWSRKHVYYDDWRIK